MNTWWQLDFSQLGELLKTFSFKEWKLQRTVLYCKGQKYPYLLTYLLTCNTCTQLPLQTTYNAIGICKVDSQLAHRSNDRKQALNGVVVNDRSISKALLLRVTILVDNPNTRAQHRPLLTLCFNTAMIV